MTDDDFLERSRRRFNRLCSAIVLVRRDRSGQLQRETIGLVPNVRAGHKQFEVVTEILGLFDKMRWCEMLGAEIPPYMGMRLAALAVMMAALDEDVDSAEWLRARLKLAPFADLTKLHVSENPEDWRTAYALIKMLFGSNWREAEHGKEFAYLGAATSNSINKQLNETEGEHIRARKAGYRLTAISELSKIEEVEDSETALRRAQRQHAVLARVPVSVQEFTNHTPDHPRLREYLKLRASGWTREAIAERPGWSWREVKRVEKRRQRLLRRIEEEDAGIPCRLVRPEGAISDASYTSVEERFYSGGTAWKHVNSEAWKRT
jgi:hypothetical protein